MIPLRNATSIAARRRGVVVNSFAPALTWQELTGERELTMTDGQARQKLLDFDRRYRLILGIADLIADSAARKRMPEVQLEYSATEREIDQLRAAHPNLLLPWPSWPRIRSPGSTAR